MLVANGSVQRKGKVWSFVVDLGPDPATGRRREARRSGYATKKAAEAALRDLATAADAGTAVSRSRITLSQFLTDWLETINNQLSTNIIRVGCPTPSIIGVCYTAVCLCVRPSLHRRLRSSLQARTTQDHHAWACASSQVVCQSSRVW